jgi:hypothetical protein
MSNPATAMHDEIIAKIANKYEIGLTSSMFGDVWGSWSSFVE